MRIARPVPHVHRFTQCSPPSWRLLSQRCCCRLPLRARSTSRSTSASSACTTDDSLSLPRGRIAAAVGLRHHVARHRDRAGGLQLRQAQRHRRGRGRQGRRGHSRARDDPDFYSGGKGPTAMPTDEGAWVRYIKALVTHFKNWNGSGRPGIAAYQVWNEANVINFWSGSPARWAA